MLHISKWFLAFLSAGMMAVATGCASGGFKLTRQYAGFVNKQHVIIRVVLYILTSVVFAVTMAVDLVLFNSQDFWEGRVSEGKYTFEGEDQTYIVEHSYEGPMRLRKSRIEVWSKDRVSLARVVEIRETESGSIEYDVDGKKTANIPIESPFST